MTGLLGNGWDDPRSAALMNLSAGLIRGDFGGGLLGANNAFQEHKQNALKKQYMDMQMQSVQSEIDARKLTAQQAAQKQALIQSLLNGGGTPAPAQPGQLGSGSFGILPTAPGVPAMPQPTAGGARVPSLSFDQLAALKMHGVDLTDIHKYANEPRKMESGSTYVDRVTGQERYMPRLPEGMAMNGGQAAFVPGYAQSVTALEGDKARATESAKAGYDLVQIAGENGEMRWVPRAQVVGSSQPRPMLPTSPRPAASEASLRPLVSGDMGANPQTLASEIAATQRDIQRVSDPASRAQLQAHLADLQRQQQAIGVQATPTTNQKLSAEAGGKINDSWLKTSYEPTIATGQGARDLLDMVQVTRQAITNLGGTGWTTQAKAAGAAILTGLGVAPRNAELFAANAEVFQTKVLEKVNQELNLAKGPQTDQDAQRAKQTWASLKNTTKANEFILDFAEAKAQRDQIKAKFYENALPVARQKGDLSEVDREWSKLAPSIFSMPSLKRWTGGVK